MKTFETFVFFAATSSSIWLSPTGIGLIVIPISTVTACGLPVGNIVKYKIIINKYNTYKKENEKDQQLIKSFDKFYRKSLEDNVINKSQNESLGTFSLNIWMEQKMNFFYKHEHKKWNYFSPSFTLVYFFSLENLKFNLEPRSWKSVYVW